MTDFFKQLKSSVSRVATSIATVAAMAVPAAAQGQTNTSLPEGGYDSFSNPEFVECVADAMSSAYPDKDIEVTANPTRKGENVSVGFGNALFGDYASANFSSFKADGNINRLGISDKFDGHKQQVGAIHQRTAEFKFFKNRAVHENVGLSEPFQAAMRGISVCETSMLAVYAARYSGENKVAVVDAVPASFAPQHD